MTNQIKILHGGDRETIQRLFGRTIEECIDALELLDASRKQNKMTREEAVTKLLNIGSQDDRLLLALEALGLLKFEEEGSVWINGVPHSLQAVKIGLSVAGYKVDKK